MRFIRPPFWFKAAVGAKTASGTPQAETATSTGSVERVVTVSGTPQAATATSTGAVERVVTVSGTPQAETATSTGSVERAITVSGTPQAETATSTGAVERILTVSGTPQAETATSSGSATVSGVFTASGTPQAATATSTGSVERVVTVSGTPQAATATSAGAVERVLTVAGTPQATTATSTGSATVTVPGARTASGTPQAQTATAVGFALVPSGRFGEFDRDNIIQPETFGVIIEPECSTKIADECFSFAVKAQCTGIDIERCNISLIGKILVDKEASGNPQAETATSTGVVDTFPELVTVSSSATAGTSFVIVCFNQELDPTCSLVNGVTITVASSPVSIQSVIAVGDSDPWCYRYNFNGEVPTVIDIGDTVVWDYDEAVGDLCAVSSATLGNTTLTITPTCTTSFPGSTPIIWTSGQNSPPVSNALWAPVDSVANTVYTNQSIINPFTDSTTLYCEFGFGDAVLDGSLDDVFFGWRNIANLNNMAINSLVGIYWQNGVGSGTWWMNAHINTAAARTTTNNTTPVAGDRVGVAIDLANLKLYGHVNGVWLDDLSGPSFGGGEPGVGLGWSIANANVTGWLWNGSADVGGCYAAVDPIYTPSGYTEVT